MVHLVLGIAIVRLGVVLALLGMRGVVGLRNDGGGGETFGTEVFV